MKNLILFATVTAFMAPVIAFAQQQNLNETPNSESTSGMETGTMGSSAPMATDSTMSTGSAMSSTTDMTGNYTIVNNLAAQNPTNTKTSEAQVMDTVAANPGLAEALKNNGINMSDVGSIQVEPNGQVKVYGKGS